METKTYDLVILNGRVMDPESGLDALRNVGILGDKIAIITEETIKGKETIDATGHVVAPGFIEAHCHSTDPFGRKVCLYAELDSRAVTVRGPRTKTHPTSKVATTNSPEQSPHQISVR